MAFSGPYAEAWRDLRRRLLLFVFVCLSGWPLFIGKHFYKPGIITIIWVGSAYFVVWIASGVYLALFKCPRCGERRVTGEGKCRRCGLQMWAKDANGG